MSAAAPATTGTTARRDYSLVGPEAEKAAGPVIQICVSRALSPRLVLDL